MPGQEDDGPAVSGAGGVADSELWLPEGHLTRPGPSADRWRVA